MNGYLIFDVAVVVVTALYSLHRWASWERDNRAIAARMREVERGVEVPHYAGPLVEDGDGGRA